MLYYGYYAKIRLLLLHEDLKLNIIKYLQANKFKITIHQFIRFVEDETIPAFEIEGKKNISRETAWKWLHHLIIWYLSIVRLSMLVWYNVSNQNAQSYYIYQNAIYIYIQLGSSKCKGSGP